MWSFDVHVSPGLYSSLHRSPVKSRVSVLKPKQLISPAGGAPTLGDVMNKFEVLGIVGEGGWFTPQTLLCVCGTLGLYVLLLTYNPQHPNS